MEQIKELNLVQWFDHGLFSIKGVEVTLASVLTVILILIATLVISRAAQRAIRRAFAARKVTDEGTIAVTTRLTHYTVLLVGFGVALNTLGIDLTALFAAGAVFAVAVGFAMQNLVQNFVSGVILLVERSITPGDVLEFDGEVVRVTRMSIRTTHVRTLSDEEVIVPNSILVQSVVKNFTLQDTLHRLYCEVGVSYGSDMTLVRETLTRAARTIEWRVRDKEPVVLLKRFGESSVDFTVSVWIDDPWGSARLRSDLYTQVWWALKEAGLVIAYPQLDVHFDPQVASGLMRAG